jgi:hypothetical protein
MADTSLIYYNDQFGKVNPRILRLEYKITAAKTASALIPNSASLITFDAFASQSVIDNYLGSTNEFLLAAFDATSMGNDAFGGLVNMCGQAKKVTQMIATCYSATNTVVTRQCQVSTALTASTLTTEVAVGDQGNIGFKVDFGNTPDFDGLTAGTIVIAIHWISK